VTARWYGLGSTPRKVRLNWFMPALVKSNVGSSAGRSDEEGTSRWPLPWKYARKRRRISKACMGEI